MHPSLLLETLEGEPFLSHRPELTPTGKPVQRSTREGQRPSNAASCMDLLICTLAQRRKIRKEGSEISDAHKDNTSFEADVFAP